MYNEIIRDLFVGDFEDAKFFIKDVSPNVICVLEAMPEGEPSEAKHMPILTQVGQEARASKNQLDQIAELIHIHLQNNNKLLIHCAAGLERSPLAVAWYLHRYHNMTIDEAYEKIKQTRPQIYIRKEWLGEFNEGS